MSAAAAVGGLSARLPEETTGVFDAKSTQNRPVVKNRVAPPSLRASAELAVPDRQIRTVAIGAVNDGSPRDGAENRRIAFIHVAKRWTKVERKDQGVVQTSRAQQYGSTS